jgi:hypothetical protein
LTLRQSRTDLYAVLLSRENVFERSLHHLAVATVVEFNVDHPQSRDRDTRCENLFHIVVLQWSEGCRIRYGPQYSKVNKNKEI